MKLRSNARTDVGKTRDHNEDTFGIGETDASDRYGDLLVVCDGMGGHAAGEVASRVAVDVILEAYYQSEGDNRAQALGQAFEAANSQVFRQGRGTMGTTGVAALFFHNTLHIANVGDSRAYLIRGEAIHQISRDHSFVSDQIAAGILTPEQARVSIHRNIITRALGHQKDVNVDLFEWPLEVGDVVLLCSDGLHGLLTDDELHAIITANTFEDAPALLVDVANGRGGTDNITVVLGRVDALDGDEALVDRSIGSITERITDRIVLPPDAPPAPPAPPARQRSLRPLIGLLASLLALVLAATVFFAAMNSAPIDHAPAATAPAATAPASTAPASTAQPTPALMFPAPTPIPLTPTRIP
ncbi:Stp1/IreP family PP2C-type Ser/Thr phosphatase [Chloroflexia bacterium SDU3-3]|nr:Stp1/IreP family PP2C-type Ser/Thr phosphatase [Chloroflexia bacterium SDU3-3]